MGNGQSCTVEYQANMHVVIVGGGYAGCYLAVNLLKSNFCKVTLIDSRDAMYHNLGAVRAVVDEDFMNNMFLPFSEMLGNSFLRGTVVGMDSNQNTLTLKSGYQVNYTHLIIATGQQSPFPYKLSGEFAELSADKAANLLSNYRNELANSERIALIGGTYDSVELAGEIKSAYPDKEVIIITEEDHLVTKRGRPAMQKNLNDLLTQKGISVAYGESVCNLDEITTNKRNDGQVLRTKLGSTIVADFVVTSLGEKLNNEFYEKVLATSLTPDGALEVNEHLKVKGHENIYAMGDVTNIDEEKTPCTPTEHAKVVKANLIAECNNENPTAYKAVMEVILVSVGKDSGVSQICGWQLGSFPARMAKGKDRTAGDTWAQLGLEIPVSKPDQCHGSKV